MITSIQIFGLTLNVSPAGVVAQPTAASNFAVRTWTGQVTGSELRLDAWIEIAGIYTFACSLRVALTVDGKPGPQPQLAWGASFFCLASKLFTAFPNSVAMNILLGPVQGSRPDFPDGALATASDGALLLMPAGMSLIEDPDLPITLTTGTGGIEVNLQALTAVLGEGAIQHQIAHGTNVPSAFPGFPGNVFSLYPRTAPNTALTVSLTVPPGDTTLKFVPGSTDELWPLHVELADVTDPNNPTANAFLALKNHQFAVSLGLGGGQPAIQSFQAEPLNGELQLLSFNYTTANNLGAAAFASSDVLQLLARTGTDGRPSTIHVDAAYPLQEVAGTKTFSLQPANGAAKVHGLATSSRFNVFPANVSSILRLRCETKVPIADATTIPAGIAASATSELTLPWLHSISASATKFYMSRPGVSYVASGAGATGGPADTYSFTATDLALPLHDPSFPTTQPATLLAHIQALDGINLKLSDAIRPITHETSLRQTPQSDAPAISPTNLMVPLLAPSVLALLPVPVGNPPILPGVPNLADQKVVRSYGPVSVTLTVPGYKEPDYYVVTDPTQISLAQGLTSVPLAGNSKEFSFTSMPPKPVDSRSAIAILKLSANLSLAEIFTQAGLDDPQIGDKHLVADLLDDTVKDPHWIGLLLIQIPLVKGPSQLGAAMVPDGLSLAYVALTPQKGANAAGPVSINARLYYTSDPNPAPAQPTNETLIHIKTADVVWYDSNLYSFYVEANLSFQGFFGVSFDAGSQPQPLSIIGTYDRVKQVISFKGSLPTPLNLLPADMGSGGLCPFQQVSLQSAEIKFINGAPSVDLGGSITLQPFLLAGGAFSSSKPIQFQGLQIDLPQPVPQIGQFLTIRYGSIQLNFDIPPFSLGFLTLKIDSLIVDWGNTFDWGSLVTLQPPSWTAGLPSLVFSLRLELMKLPELALGGLDRLTLDFYVGLGLKDNGTNKRWSPDVSALAIRALGFDHLDLDLLRFLEVRAQSIQFGKVKDADGTPVTALELVNVTVLVLGRTILSNVSAYLFAGSASGPAFALFFGDTSTVGPLRIRWALIGQNVNLDPSFASTLIDVGFSDSDQDDKVRAAIQASGANLDFLKPGGRAQGTWVFAAAFDVASIFDGKFLFQDRAYYGIAIGGGIFKNWFGYDVAISVLYIKGDTPNHDSFRVTLRVPQVTLPAFTFMGGELMLQIVLDGGFLLDVGFPHLNPDGSRQWDRALGAIVFPFQGSGGFYIQKFSVYQAVPPTGQTTGGMLISAGYALQAGLGGCFGGGPFTAWVTAGFYYIIEGSVYLDNGDMQALRLSGAVGIVVRGGASLNFWIISASIEIVLSAEARVTLAWGNMPAAYLLIGSDQTVPAGPPTVSLDVTLYASASAQACIGGGWFRICASISVTLPIRYHIDLQL